VAGESESPREEDREVEKRPGEEVLPRFKTEEIAKKFQAGIEEMESLEYGEAKKLFYSCLSGATGKGDREIVQGFLDDAKLGLEIENARKTGERSGGGPMALNLLRGALEKYPGSKLVPEAEKLIREIEERIYLILDDFEPESGSLTTQSSRKAPFRNRRDRAARWAGSEINSDPRFVIHGKGSLKWEMSAGPRRRRAGRLLRGGYESAGFKNPIARWRYLVFWLYLPEPSEGTLQVLLSPNQKMNVLESLYSKKLIDLRGRMGWLPVKLDLHRDFGNTGRLRLDQVRYIGIYPSYSRPRTVYLDFVHLE
jgi:hypothetical protein